MVNTWLHVPGNKPEKGVSYPDLTEALTWTREHWLEEKGSQMFWFTNEQDEFLASMFNDVYTDNAVTTVFNTGEVQRHHVRYVLDGAGEFDHAEVTRLSITKP